MYTITKKRSSVIVCDHNSRPLYWMINDSMESDRELGQELLAKYLHDAKEIFKSECDILLDENRTFVDTDSERLIIMLKLLIDARKTWQEEAVQSK